MMTISLLALLVIIIVLLSTIFFPIFCDFISDQITFETPNITDVYIMKVDPFKGIVVGILKHRKSILCSVSSKKGIGFYKRYLVFLDHNIHLKHDIDYKSGSFLIKLPIFKIVFMNLHVHIRAINSTDKLELSDI